MFTLGQITHGETVTGHLFHSGWAQDGVPGDGDMTPGTGDGAIHITPGHTGAAMDMDTAIGMVIGTVTGMVIMDILHIMTIHTIVLITGQELL